MTATIEKLPAGRAMCDDAPVSYDAGTVAARAAQRQADGQPAPVREIPAWAVIGPEGKIAEFSAYLMAFNERQDAVNHALPQHGERVVRIVIREVDAA